MLFKGTSLFAGTISSLICYFTLLIRLLNVGVITNLAEESGIMYCLALSEKPDQSATGHKAKRV